MAIASDADRQKAAVWAGLDALGRSRPHLLLEGSGEGSYLARWRNSPVPAGVLAARLRQAIPGATILSLRSWLVGAGLPGPGRRGQPPARRNVAIEFALGPGPGPGPDEGQPPTGELLPDAGSQEGKPCAEG